MKDFQGLDVVDADGTKIGTVEHTFVAGDQPRYVEVKMGTLFAKHRLVPLENTRQEDGNLQVPYSKTTIEDSPRVDGDDSEIGESTLSSVENYYQGAPPLLPQSAPSNPPPASDAAQIEDNIRENVLQQGSEQGPPVVVAYNTGDVEDRGDYIDVPILEQGIGQPAVVKEVLRIPKKRGYAVPSTATWQNVSTTPSEQR